jgi:uncharacterized protein YceH (UPF0502 family)
MSDTALVLNPVELRVLGALIEKSLTTPDAYPLSLNALTNACNQLTNREPVVSFDEQTVVRALDGLYEKRLAFSFDGVSSRVAKYKHALTDVIELNEGEVALLCVLMLRGPQTVGELRTRTERLHPFASPAEVETALQALSIREPHPLVVKLPRQPGFKESRHAHLLGGEVMLEAPATPRPEPAVLAVRAENERVAKLEEEVAALRNDVTELKQQFAEFKKQFE